MSDVKSCEIIKDLFPLYKDGIVSQETEELIRTHIAACADCRLLYEKIQIEDFERNRALDESSRYKKIAKKIRRKRLGILSGVVGLLLFVWVLSCNMFQRAIVSGICMEPAILNNENYILNRWSYRISSPKRNEIIIYESEGIYYMTRIIGLPGETVEMKAGTIYINGNLLTGQSEYFEEGTIPPIQLEDGEYLTIVDNLEVTSDGSRCITKNDIVGKVWITH